MWKNRINKKVIVFLILILALIATFFAIFACEDHEVAGESSKSEKTLVTETSQSALELTETETSKAALEVSESEAASGSAAKADNKSTTVKENSKTLDKYLTEPTPEGEPTPVEPQAVQIDKKKVYTCTLSISCNTILDNIDKLDPEKVELVPEDGVILPTTTIEFYEGESVFDALYRATKNNKIHFEYVNTPVYNSAYIEGIHNLYEFDCGELSGWMYKVNDWFPNYGCSRYQLKDDDVIEWLYTCDLGRDVGGDYSVGGE